MNWSDCPIVEVIPGKVSGVPLIKNSRVPVQTVIENFDDGISPDEIADEFSVPLASVKAVIEFARRKRAAGSARS